MERKLINFSNNPLSSHPSHIQCHLYANEREQEHQLHSIVAIWWRATLRHIRGKIRPRCCATIRQTTQCNSQQWHTDGGLVIMPEGHSTSRADSLPLRRRGISRPFHNLLENHRNNHFLQEIKCWHEEENVNDQYQATSGIQCNTTFREFSFKFTTEN